MSSPYKNLTLKRVEKIVDEVFNDKLIKERLKLEKYIHLKQQQYWEEVINGKINYTEYLEKINSLKTKV